ncbi:MAG TPA: MFS transporter [Candidatus Eisenbacteria bacterium]|nr:MFS transporter [Candidatus Eisenbacteria bacterium]
MVRVLGGVVGEYLHQVRGSGRNPRLYLQGLFLIGLGQSIFSLLFNLYLRTLGLSDSAIGQILSKISLGAAIAAIPAAFLFHGLKPRLILVGAGAMAALLYVMQVSLTAPETLLLIAFLTGMAATVYRLSIAPVVMREVAPGARPFLFSAAFTVLFLSAIIGFAIGGLLPQLFHLATDVDRLALRWSLYVAAGLILTSAIPFNAMKETTPPLDPEESDYQAAPRRRFSDQFGWTLRQARDLIDVDWVLNLKLTIPALLIGLGAGLIIPFMNLYFHDRFGLGEAEIGVLFAVMQGFMVVGNLFGPAVSRRLGLVRGVVVTQLLSVPFMVVLGVSSFFPLVAAAFFLRSGLMNMNQPLTSHFAMEVVSKRDHAVTNSLLSLSWFVAWSISADIGGALIERSGYTTPLLIAAGLYVAASVLYWLFFKDVEEGRVPRGEVEIPEA